MPGCPGCRVGTRQWRPWQQNTAAEQPTDRVWEQFLTLACVFDWDDTFAHGAASEMQSSFEQFDIGMNYQWRFTVLLWLLCSSVSIHCGDVILRALTD